MTTKLDATRARKNLALTWFIAAGILFVTFFIQTLAGKYGDKTEDAWSWFLPTIIPALTLITGVLVADALSKNTANRSVDRFIYHLTLFISLIYLLAVALVIFLQPFLTTDPFTLMKSSNFGLAPLQGLVTACMGVFFVRRET
ncbi:MAG: hypothetical protein FJY10_07330 [Bacteroidetes bacterium]|nr:hypothetical protein [Bacteroidota bacterium]